MAQEINTYQKLSIFSLIVIILSLMIILILFPRRYDRYSYENENQLIETRINNIVNVDCEGTTSNDDNPWYCQRPKYQLQTITPTLENLYALGTATLKNGEKYWWAAKKINNFWQLIVFESQDHRPPLCDEIADFPQDIFGGKFSNCI